MPAQQRQLVFMVAAAAVLLVIVGILHLAGAVIATGAHDKRTVVCFVLAAVDAIVA